MSDVLARRLSWWRSERDQRIHAWTGETWCGDEVALCQHPCPPLHVICDERGPRCATCSRAAERPVAR